MEWKVMFPFSEANLDQFGTDISSAKSQILGTKFDSSKQGKLIALRKVATCASNFQTVSNNLLFQA